MAKLLILFVSLMAVTSTTMAQYTVRGTVKDETTGRPIENASVYFNNTQIGTQTNANGAFMLHASAPYPSLVISSIGYQRMVLDNPKKDSKFQISLLPQDNTLKPVIVGSGGWTKWGTLFTRVLLGKDPHDYLQAKILNSNDIKFQYDRTTGILTAVAYAPILISHPRLGYKLKLDLEKFEYNLGREELDYEGSVFFEEEMGDFTKEQVQVATNLSYLGSRQHFLKSLANHSLAAEGFKIYRYTSKKNPEKERVAKVLQKLKQDKILSGYTNYYIGMNQLVAEKDSVKYYSQILRQPDVVSRKLAEITEDSIATYDVARKTASVKFADTVLVVYQINPKLIRSHLIPAVRSNDHQPPPSETITFFVNNTPLVVAQSGQYYGNSLMMIGDMADKRLANSLPLDFDFNVPRFARKDE